MYLDHNGKIIRSDTALLHAGNRSFRYGDGLFETIRYINGRSELSELHFERWFSGMKLLGFDPPSYYSKDYFLRQIDELVKKNGHPEAARIRLVAYRGDGGIFDPENDFPNYIIESQELNKENLKLNENGLDIDIFPDARKSCDTFSNIKSNNFLPYFMGAKYSKQNHLNDCLLLNTHDRIADSCIANLFMIKEGILITPSLSEGPVAGVMRKFILLQGDIAGFKIQERPVSIDDLLSADECFLTNSIYGIRWVKSCRNKTYTPFAAQTIFTVLSQTISS